MNKDACRKPISTIVQSEILIGSNLSLSNGICVITTKRPAKLIIEKRHEDRQPCNQPIQAKTLLTKSHQHPSGREDSASYAYERSSIRNYNIQNYPITQRHVLFSKETFTQQLLICVARSSHNVQHCEADRIVHTPHAIPPRLHATSKPTIGPLLVSHWFAQISVHPFSKSSMGGRYGRVTRIGFLNRFIIFSFSTSRHASFLPIALSHNASPRTGNHHKNVSIIILRHGHRNRKPISFCLCFDILIIYRH